MPHPQHLGFERGCQASELEDQLDDIIVERASRLRGERSRQKYAAHRWPPKVSSPGLEPGTASVLDWSHNQLDHEDAEIFAFPAIHISRTSDQPLNPTRHLSWQADPALT